MPVVRLMGVVMAETQFPKGPSAPNSEPSGSKPDAPVIPKIIAQNDGPRDTQADAFTDQSARGVYISDEVLRLLNIYIHNSDKRQENESRNRDLQTNINVIIAALSMISTIVISIYTVKLWMSTDQMKSFSEQQTKIMNDQFIAINKSLNQTDQSLKISANQLEESKTTNELTKTNYRLQLSPYIVFDDLEVRDYVPRLAFKNSGQTPAFGLTSINRLTITDETTLNDILSQKMDEMVDYDDPKSYTSVIGAGLGLAVKPYIYLANKHGDGRYRIDLDPNGEYKKAYSDFSEKGKIYWIYGVIRYASAYGDRFSTRYCFYFKGSDVKIRTPCHINNDIKIWLSSKPK